MLHTAVVSLSQTGQGSAPISEEIHIEMTSITDSGMIFTNDVRKKQFVMICAQTQKVNHFVLVYRGSGYAAHIQQLTVNL